VRFTVTAEVEAEQINRGRVHLLPDRFQAAICRCGAMSVAARPSPVHIHTPAGPVPLKHGDWLVEGTTGKVFLVPAGRFTQTYKPCTDGKEVS